MPHIVSPAFSRAVGYDSSSHNEALTHVLRAYDRSVLACNARDHLTAHRSIGLLRAALDLDTEASRTFDSLFAWCETAIDRRDYSSAARCLSALRNAWENASLVRAPESPSYVERFANALSRGARGSIHS